LRGRSHPWRIATFNDLLLARQAIDLVDEARSGVRLMKFQAASSAKRLG